VPGPETLGPALVAWIALAIALGGLSQGALGLGFPTIATPLIALATDMRTAVICVLLPCLACVLTSMCRSGPLRPVLSRFWMVPLCALAGAALGTRLFVAYPAFPYPLLLASMIFVYLGVDRFARSGWALPRRLQRALGVPFGFAAGLSEGTANVAAPPLVVYYLGLGLAPATLVQAMNLCFLAGKTTQFAVIAASGSVTPATWLATLPLAAIAVGATLAGTAVRERIDEVSYRRWLKRSLAAIALLLVAEHWYGAVLR
jgi:uncharacterized membrane protein YfcA